jgi:DNA-binding NarL/FixJ family response regulator
LHKSIIRVLVVEDFEPFQHFICSTLEKNPGLRVICKASDGVAAVQQAQRIRPDLILIDVGLPKLNGIEAARQIRDTAPNSKILFLSQNSDANVVQRAFDVGANGYVLKTMAGTDLLPAIDAVISGQRFLSSGLPDFSDPDKPDGRRVPRNRLSPKTAKGHFVLPRSG